MKEIIMKFNGKAETFQITYECKDYCFCECKSNPSARGFFTAGYIKNNKQ